MWCWTLLELAVELVLWSYLLELKHVLKKLTNSEFSLKYFTFNMVVPYFDTLDKVLFV